MRRSSALSTRLLALPLALVLLALLAVPAAAQATGAVALTVRVVSTAGNAEAGATVYAGPPGTTVATCTLRGQCGSSVGTTDTSGKLAYAPAAAGPLVVCAVAPSPNLFRYVGCTDPFTPTAGSTVTVVAQPIPPSPLSGTQAGSGAITLLVQDASGRPLPNTPTVLGSAPGAIAEYQTGADGSLTFENVSSIEAPCAYVFSYQAAQFTQSGCLGPISVAPWGGASATLRLSPGASPQMPIGAVVFTVVDPSGRPMPGVFISVPVNPDIITHYGTDAQGRFSFLAVAGVPTPPIYFKPDTPYASVMIGPLTVGPGEIKQVTVTVTLAAAAPTPAPSAPAGSPLARGWIDGRVTFADGAPAAGVLVQVVGTPLSTRTAADGSYQFPGVSVIDGADGGPTYTVSVIPPPGYAAVGPASRQVAVQADHGVAADFTLQPAPCRFVLGFKALHDALPAVVGDCLDDERHNPTNGGALQHTAHGLLVWRKADNFTAFTDGYRTWVNGPHGIQERLNSQRFPWEANPDGLPVVR